MNRGGLPFLAPMVILSGAGFLVPLMVLGAFSFADPAGGLTLANYRRILAALVGLGALVATLVLGA